MTALEYLKKIDEIEVDDAEWKLADRALWAAYELLGLQGRIASQAQLGSVRATAIRILELFPEGLPEPGRA